MFLIFRKQTIGNMVFNYAELICLILNAGRFCVHVAKEKKGDWGETGVCLAMSFKPFFCAGRLLVFCRLTANWAAVSYVFLQLDCCHSPVSRPMGLCQREAEMRLSVHHGHCPAF